MITAELFSPVWLITAGIIWAVYAIIILRYYKGWLTLESFNAPSGPPWEKVSVIIPCHNEEASLPLLIRDLINQDYPEELLEIIFVNDHSTDHTGKIIQQAARDTSSVRAIQNEGKGKKEALLSAIRQSSYPFIISTDADVSVKPRWVSTMVALYKSSRARFIAGPVMIIPEKGFLSKFQALEFFSLVGAGMGAAASGHPIYCNGANIAYEKSILSLTTDPFRKPIPSGDDVFLLQTVKKYAPGSIRFLKSQDATVITAGEKSLTAFLRQRIRWASKGPGYHDTDMMLTACFVLGINLFITFFFLVAFFHPGRLIIAFSLLFLKSIPDFLLLYSVTSYFKQKNLMLWFPISQLLYPFYSVITGIAGIMMSLRQRKSGYW